MLPRPDLFQQARFSAPLRAAAAGNLLDELVGGRRALKSVERAVFRAPLSAVAARNLLNDLGLSALSFAAAEVLFGDFGFRILSVVFIFNL